MQGTHQEMHREHQQWVSDAALWQDEVAIWDRHAEQALAELVRLESSLRHHLRALAQHADAVVKHMEKVRLHEHSLAEFEEVGTDDALLLMAKRHRAEAALHQQQLELQREMKRQHAAVMEQWRQQIKRLAQNVGN